MTTERPGVAFFEHTADIGLEIRGRTLEELFRWAAMGLRQVVAGPVVLPTPSSSPTAPIEPAGRPAGSRVRVSLSGAPDPEALLVDWLNFLVYIFETEDRLPGDGPWELEVEGRAEATWRLDGWFEGIPVAPGLVVTAVKGATLHGLEIAFSKEGLYHARVVLDV